MSQPIATVAQAIRAHAASRPGQPALRHGDVCLDYRQLDAAMDRVAAALQRDGARPGAVVSICALNSVPYAVAYLGAIRAGLTVAPLPASSSPAALAAMLADCRPGHLFLDAAGHAVVAQMDVAGAAAAHAGVPDATARPPGQADGPPTPCRVALDAQAPYPRLEAWQAPAGSVATTPDVDPALAFNIIYSSGTTGTPKGIAQPYGMRGAQLLGGSSVLSGYDADSVTLLSTPLYSNTTLVSFFATLGRGATVILMDKFEPAGFLALARRHGATHAMLVPAQYQRLLDHGDTAPLPALQTWMSTSAPFAPVLKRAVLARWPARLVETYGMTEGGGSCLLQAHAHPDKLHTVGQPLPGHDIRLIDEAGVEVAPGGVGEIVGRSGGMMTGYLNQPERSAEAEWHDAQGQRFIRTGDVGRFDADGFLVLLDRKKDMIISGGFNLYPSDLEAELVRHPAVREASVVGVASTRWGETPVAFVVAHDDAPSPDTLKAWANARLGRMQKLADVRYVEHLPRSAIGKVLKRELREAYEAQAAAAA